ncbi:MAG: 30S ribosomal protein S3 [Phycisphaerae bacterium]|nr:30S ribosomal protein S3 [Phycisphaerae bacterium]
MGQKVNPTGFRTGVTIGWKSRWYAPKSNYGEFLVEDQKIRKFLDTRLNRTPPFAAVSAIEIERTREEVKVLLKTARPGIVIGPKGAEVDNLKSALEDLTDRRVSINIVEVRDPDLDAQLVAEGIAEQLKRRSSFRRTMKQRAEGSMQAGARGVKIQVSGRLGGAEMSRSETTILGSIPLHTLEADVDYGFVPCFTTYGCIGVKVWIYRGLFGEQPTEEEKQARARASEDRRGRRSRRGAAARTRGQRKAPKEAPVPTGAAEAPAAAPVTSPAPEASAPAAESASGTTE